MKRLICFALVLSSCGTQHPQNLPCQPYDCKAKVEPKIDPNPLCHLEKGHTSEQKLEILLGEDPFSLFVNTKEEQEPICSVSPTWYECQCPIEQATQIQQQQQQQQQSREQALRYMREQQGQQGQQIAQQQTGGQRECLLFDLFFCF